MTRGITGLFAGSALALAAGAGGAALAQPGPAGHQHGRPGAIEAHRFDPQEKARKLSEILQLRPNQQAAALAYAQAMAPAQGGMKPGAEDKPATTPERLARMEQRMAERQAAMRARIEATRRFYAQLDPAQKKAFDSLGPMMMMRGHGRGHGKHMMMRHHDHGGPGAGMGEMQAPPAP